MTEQTVARKVTTTTKSYDEEGNLVTEEIYEEIEYAQPSATPVNPWAWWQYPIVSNKSMYLDPPTVDTVRY